MNYAFVTSTPGPEYRRDSRQWQGIPTVERTADEKLWAAWYTGGPGEGPGNYVVVATSDDDGLTWQEPALIVAPPAGRRCFDPCLWTDPRGRLWLFWAESTKHWDGVGGVWFCRTDDADTWTAPRRICDGIMMNKPTVLSTGEWLLPVAVWRTPGSSHVVCSTDAGETFTVRGAATVPESSCDEHMFVERRDGSLWMLVRTKYGIGESFSTDRGVTWSPGQRSALAGVDSRFFIRRLPSGALVLVNHDSAGQTERLTRRSRLTAWVSDDDGRTWRGGLLLDERPAVSYPDGVVTGDGRIFVIYDRERGDTHWRPAGAVGAREILLAAFTEADVRAGRCRSGLRQIVNKIPGSDE